MSKLTVAGIGPGEADYILPAVIEKMKKAHTVIVAKRVLPVLEELCQDVSDSASVLQHDSTSFFAMGKIKDARADWKNSFRGTRCCNGSKRRSAYVQPLSHNLQ